MHYKLIVLRTLFLSIIVSMLADSCGLAQDKLPDSLFVNHTITMPPDYEGDVVVTVTEPLSQPQCSHAVLYIHGFNDYFFQSHLADSVVAWGIRFYALDLRKYGRSYLPHQRFNNVRDLSEYYADIDSALYFMHAQGVEQVTLLGHSTGGLIASLYADAHPNSKLVCSVALNSPFLDMNMGWALERLAIPVVAALGKQNPDKVLPVEFPPYYGHSLHRDAKGIWEYNLEWKPHVAPPVNQGWIRAIYLAQQKIKRRLAIPYPVLVMHSDSSTNPVEWSDAIYTTDAVLDVDDIERYANYLGEHVTTATVPDGVHDLALSKTPARRRYFALLKSWLKCKF
jgi:alpha-beta hydrolase superfamily lysophospholipase